MELTDDQWAFLSDDLTHPREIKPGRGRPPVPARKIFEAVLWTLRTGAKWSELPRKFPPYQTVHRRYQQWNIEKKTDTCQKKLAQHMKTQGNLDLSECSIDGTFASAKNKASELVRQSAEKGTKIMAILDRNGLPVAAWAERASPAEVTLVHDTLDVRWTKG